MKPVAALGTYMPEAELLAVEVEEAEPLAPEACAREPLWVPEAEETT